MQSSVRNLSVVICGFVVHGKLFFLMFDVFVVLSPALLRLRPRNVKGDVCSDPLDLPYRFLTHTALLLVLKFYRESEREGRESERGENRNKYSTLTRVILKVPLHNKTLK